MMERVLEYGALEDVRLVMEVFGKSRFLDMVAGATRVSAKTAAFWRSLLEQEGVSCTKKFSRNTVWNC
jgi:hypothetical protein